VNAEVEQALTMRSRAEPARWPWNAQSTNRLEETPHRPSIQSRTTRPRLGHRRRRIAEESGSVSKDGEWQAAQEASSMRGLGGGGGEDEDHWHVGSDARAVAAGCGNDRERES
jgi:hypothetical protein